MNSLSVIWFSVFCHLLPPSRFSLYYTLINVKRIFCLIYFLWYHYEMESSFAARPLVGRLIALDIRPTRALTFLGPAWATLCGAIASGGLTLRGQTLLTLTFCFLLSDALLGAWRSLWLQSDWR